MLIGILSDIHGNHLACERVLRDAKALGVDELFVLGDFVGYYYRPDKVLSLLDSWQTTFIKGNHEVMLAQAAKDPAVAEAIRSKYGSGIKNALRVLSQEQILMLQDLPAALELERDSVRIMLCHGSPWDPDVYIYPNSPEEILERVCQRESDFVFLGHSHYPFAFSRGNTTAINVGSVGQARDRGGFASWATLDTVSRTFTLRLTPYETDELIAEVKQTDPHRKYLYEVLERNYGQK